MFSFDKPFTLDSVVRMVLAAAFILGLIWLLGYLSSALIPFVVALLLAYLLNPLTCFLQKYVKSRGVAVGLTLVLTLICVSAVVLIVVPQMISEFIHMGKVVSEIFSNGALSQRIAEYLPADIWQWLHDTMQSAEVKEFFTSAGALKAAKSTLQAMVPGLKGVAAGTLSLIAWLVGLFVILLYVIFLLADFGKIKREWKDYLPEEYREPVVGFLDEFEDTMSRYFRGQIIVCAIVGVLMSIGFIAIGLPMGLVLGLLIGALNIAPYLGMAGAVPAILFAGLDSIQTGESVWVGIGLVILVMSVVQIIQDGILVPKIQGDSMGLSPWLILLSLSVWGKMLGFLGLLIALPMTCLCLSYYRRFLASRK